MRNQWFLGNKQCNGLATKATHKFLEDNLDLDLEATTALVVLEEASDHVGQQGFQEIVVKHNNSHPAVGNDAAGDLPGIVVIKEQQHHLDDFGQHLSLELGVVMSLLVD